MEESKGITLSVNPWIIFFITSFFAALAGLIALITTIFIIRAFVIYEFGLNSFDHYLS